MFFVISFSIDNIAVLVSLYCDMVDRKYVLVNLNLLKERSPETTVIGIVKNNLYAVIKFGQLESSPYINLFMNSFKYYKKKCWRHFKSGPLGRCTKCYFDCTKLYKIKYIILYELNFDWIIDWPWAVLG